MADLTRKTANLLDVTLFHNGYHINSQGNIETFTGRIATTTPIDVSNYTSVTFSYTTTRDNDNFIYATFSGNTLVERVAGKTSEFTIDTTNCNKLYLCLYNLSSQVLTADIITAMLNEGSTPLPYEPYGWVHSLRKLGTETETIQSGDTIYTNGQPISTYSIKGNTVQDGTPTPSNPVSVNGVGDKTANLLNPNTMTAGYAVSDSSGNLSPSANDSASDYIDVSGFTTVYIRSYQTARKWGAFYDENKVFVSGFSFYTSTQTVPQNAAYMRVTITTANLDTAMVVKGSTAPTSYIPYGYKIPISSGQTVNNYLGSIQSTRQINKIVFDGTETGWDKGTYAFYYTINDMYIRSQVICTHYEYYDGTSSSAPTNSISTASGVGTSIWIKTADHDTTTLDQWKAYLQAQYAAGTPVTVYYVLATPTTGVVNRLLMKIGTYADSISNSAAIPTTEGANSITVDTTVQPSEFTATWTGWHDASVKEKSENLFDKDNTTIENGYLYDTGTSFSWTSASDSRSVRIACETNTQYTLSVTTVLPIFRIGLSDDSNPSPRGITCTKVVNGSNINQYTFTTGASDKYIIFQGTGSMVDTWISELMLVKGSAAPSQYEPYWK